MMQQILLSFGGSATTSSSLQYTDDMFSTFLYDGQYSNLEVNNNVDLSNDGGLVWFKNRDYTRIHSLFDSVFSDSHTRLKLPNGATQALGNDDGIISYDSDGFTTGFGDGDINQGGFGQYVSWCFRQAPGFFDAVEYTGNTSNSQSVNHNLGCNAGMVIITRADSTGSNFGVYFKDGGSSEVGTGYLNNTDAFTTGGIAFGSSSSSFTVYDSSFNFNANENGVTYRAYVFAGGGDTASEIYGENNDESVIKCGTVTTNGSSLATVTLGWEPQWVMMRTISGGGWFIHDVMRGAPVQGDSRWIYANSNATESASSVSVRPNSTGFTAFNHSTNQNMIYVAIRRPHRPATSAADVFKVYKQSTGTAAEGDVDYGITADLVLFKKYNSNSNNNLPIWVDRLRGEDSRLDSTSTSLQYFDNGSVNFDRQDGITINSDASNLYSGSFSYRHYVWKRAAGFFDMVTWSGGGSGTQNVAHNLQVSPEMVIVKMFKHDNSSYGGDQWYVYHKNLGTDTGGSSDNYNSVLALNTTASQTSFSGGGIFGSAPTASNLPFDNPSYDSSAVTGDTDKMWVAYLFASLDGVSKVGYYTGMPSPTAYLVTLGFTPKFVMIKAADRTGDWVVFDSERGLTVGGTSAEAVALNNTDNETQTGLTGNIRASGNGFVVVTNANSDINEDGKKYIYYAVA